MSDSTDHYEVLGVSPSAKPSQIKAAYRVLAKKHHPDGGTNPDRVRMAEINVAYGILIDPIKREAYDLDYRAEERKRASSPRRPPGPSRGASSPPPPPPPKAYTPILHVEETSIYVEAVEGQTTRLRLPVTHINGELPPRWELSVALSGDVLDRASFSLDPPDRFPAVLTVEIPGKTPGDYAGELEIFINEL